ncbi:unnamed protein product, partial [Tetraodon nigroviridis]
MMKFLPKLLLLALLAFPSSLLIKGPEVSAQDLTEDEEAEAGDEDTVDDVTAEDEDDEAEVEDDENTELTEEKEDEEEEALVGEVKASPHADTTILFVKGEDFPANNIVKFLLGFTNKGSENFVVESLDASFRYPQVKKAVLRPLLEETCDLWPVCFLPGLPVLHPELHCSPAGNCGPSHATGHLRVLLHPRRAHGGGGRSALVINLNYKDSAGNVFQDAVFNQTVTVTEKEDGLDGETIFMYVFLSGLGLLVIIGLHQLLESRKRRPAPKVEMGTSSHNGVDLSWIPQETLNQINKASPKRSPRKRSQKRSAGSDE